MLKYLCLFKQISTTFSEETSCSTTKTQEMPNREINEDTGRSEHSKALFQ